MFKLVGLQFLLAILCMFVGFSLSGWIAGVSAGLGAAVYCLPTLVCVLYLARGSRRPGGAKAHHVFVGEAIKIALALAAMMIVSAKFPGVSWPAFIAGLIVTLQANFFALLVRS
ncbi:MAG: ATP synthase subunit I [Candidatus Dactylopiibacterium sp.]|nr:ATP synthase subunit I [Candidatus Dactylopiibacterium sp.]